MVEGQRRAARLSAALTALSGLALSSLLLTPPLWRESPHSPFQPYWAFIFWLAWPVKRQVAASPLPNQRVDERTIMFARARVEPGTPQFEAYYREHPEHLAPDTAFRANPGLLQPGSAFYDALLSASPDASFFLTGVLRDQVDGPVASEKVEKSPEDLTRFVKGLAAYHGAVDSGVCELQPTIFILTSGAAPVNMAHRSPSITVMRLPSLLKWIMP